MSAQILIIEDDQPIRDSIRELLESEGYGVQLAENGLQGMELLSQKISIDAILLDLSMPVMDGRTFITRFKTEFPELRSLPVIIMTAAGNNEIALFPHEWVIRKPLEVDDLLDTLERILARAR